jgi:hypothetical protein
MPNNSQRFEYGAFGILKHLPIKPLYVLLNVTMLKINTIRQMTYIFCCMPFFYFSFLFSALDLLFATAGTRMAMCK